MENKKSKKADLEKKRFLFFEIGYIVAIGLVLVAFEWTSQPSEVKGFASNEKVDVVQENIPITRQEARKEPPPPPPQSTEVLNIVDNNVDIEDELVLEQTGADETSRVQIDAFVEEEAEEDEDIFVIVEDMPSFKGGGLNAFSLYIQKSLKYPPLASENGIEGTVYIRFIVEKDGSINRVEVLRGVDPVLDDAAVAAVERAPKWEPGKQRGMTVRVSCTIPIMFALD